MFLGMYSLRIKKKFGRNTNLISTNDFLSEAYKDFDKKFEEGFVQDVIKMFDLKTFKNDKNTHGGILEDWSFNNNYRTLDLMINGGLTGVQQYIIDEAKNKRVVSNRDTVGLMFFARIWFPANSNSAYIFIQKYGALSIKPLYDSIIKKILDKYDFSLVGRKLHATTTKKRQKEFFNNSRLLDVVLVSKKSVFDTNSIHANKATIKLSSIKNVKNTVEKEEIDDLLSEHGLSISNKHYDIKATYVRNTDGFNEKKTAEIDDTEETINIIPNVIVSKDCINADNSPNFKRMQTFIDNEIEQIKKEAKKS